MSGYDREDTQGFAIPRGLESESQKKPPRGPLSPEVEKAAREIHREVWREPYVPGRGPMHHAGGPYWREALLTRATMWERYAKAARVCAEALPDA